MKTIQYKIIVFCLILINCSLFAQYNGGDSDGNSSETILLTSCATPASFFPYFGGNSDAAAVDILENTTCPFSNHFYAYFGGQADGAAVETIENNVCSFPPSFYPFFGGDSDGSTVESTTSICSILPPVAAFTASATAICVGQSVTFTDTSTNMPSAWTWTLPGAVPSTSTDQNPTVVYNTAGTYNVTLKAVNYNGSDTKIVNGFITVTAYPSILTTTPASRCDAGSVTLNATASAGILNWYANASGGTSLASGTNFTTPNLTATTTYYVEAVNGVCSSARTAVIATVNTTPNLISTTSASRCGNGTVILQAAASSGTIQWFANASGGTVLATGVNFTTPSLNSTTSYFVQVSENNCVSPRTEVIATINSLPSITSTTPASRCGNGTVTLQAVASSGTLNWYASISGGTSLATGSNFTTPSLSITTTYYVEAVNGTCSSGRTPVVATITNAPIITSTAPGNRCDAGTVNLSAASSAGNVVWYANPTGGTALFTGNNFTTPNISTTTSYFAEAVNGQCVSGTRTEVIATINPSPIIISTTPMTFCGGTFTISATASSGTLAWYNVPSGGIVQGTGNNFSLSNWATTTTFYVQATNGSCQSPRVPVVVTVNQKPFNTTLSPATRCGAGSVTLGATYTIGTAYWYDVPSGGTSLGSGPTFITPNISNTTTYYVEAVNNGCVSVIRTAITATITNVDAPTGNSPQTFCPGANLTQLVVNGNNIVWYDASTGGNILPDYTPLVSGTTYYASQSNGSCESANRLAVTATSQGCLEVANVDYKEFRLYPIPVVDILNISFPSEILKVVIYDLSGKIVVSKVTKNREVKVDMSALPASGYLVAVTTKELTKNYKVIKK